MARYIKALCKLCRREGEKLFLKGDKCYSEKCPFKKRSYAPGQHGNNPARISDYRQRLREKQKARRIYGIGERQFRRYYEIANASAANTGEKLMAMLETRLDNVVYRLGLAFSRNHARQMVRHNHFRVNGQRVNIPSFEVRAGDIIALSPKSQNLIKTIMETTRERSVPAWMNLAADKIESKIISAPKREDIETQIEEQLIVEFYAR